jgi:hypothetical protein
MNRASRFITWFGSGRSLRFSKVLREVFLQPLGISAPTTFLALNPLLLDGSIQARSLLRAHRLGTLGTTKRYAIDASKLENELGWKAEETFSSGIAKTVNWYIQNKWWWAPLRERAYAGERIGLIPGEGNVRA